MKVAGRVRLNPIANDQLQELSVKRGLEGNPIASRTAIAAELILKAHKKECK